MSRCHLVFLAVGLPIAPSPGQQPAPFGESRARDLLSPWNAEEAMAFAWLDRTAAALRRDPDARLQLPGNDVPPGFAAQCHPAVDGGFGEGVGSADRGRRVLYLWPATTGVDLVFCLASDGRLLVRDNGGRYVAGEAPAADAATGSGSRGAFADILPSSGKGRDGGFWQTPQTLRPRRLQIALRDDKGEPVAGGRVVLAPRSWLGRSLRVLLSATAAAAEPQERALPAGSTDLDSTGNGTLQGIAAPGLVVCAGDASGLVALPQDAIVLEGDRMQLTLPLATMRQARVDANECAAIATLKNICSAQAQCQASAAIDANNNGAGEYGFFGELSGSVPVRSGGQGPVNKAKISPPVLSFAFSNVQDARVVRSGYVFQMFLPGADGAAVAEAATGGGAGCKVDPRKAEVLWCCYAWPAAAGSSGRRVFFVNQSGDVLAAANADGRCSGAEKPVDPKAAFAAAGTGLLDAAIAANSTGQDGQGWTVVN